MHWDRPIKLLKIKTKQDRGDWLDDWKGALFLGGGEYPGYASRGLFSKILVFEITRANARFEKTPDTEFFFSRRFAPRSSVILKRWTVTNFIEPLRKYFLRSKSTLGSLKECFQCILGRNRRWVGVTLKTLAFESLQSGNRSSQSDFT